MRTISMIVVCIPILSISCLKVRMAISEELQVKQKTVKIKPIYYTGWKEKTFKDVGLKLELPKQASSDSSPYEPCMVTVSMHYLYPPLLMFMDAIIYVQIYIERIPLKKLKEELEGTKESNLFKNSTKEKNAYWFWRFKFQERTSRWDEPGNYTYYRRDIKINDNEILHAYAEVLNAGCKENIHADHAAVRRILDSIEPLQPEK